MSGAPGTMAGGQPMNSQSMSPLLQLLQGGQTMGANPMSSIQNPGSSTQSGFGQPMQTPPQQGLPPAVPARNPPFGGVAGNPGYSSAKPAQLSGNYWNQVAQQLAGPTYQASGQGTAASGSMPNASTPPLGSYPITNSGQGRPFMNIGSGISGRRAYNV